MTKQDLLNLDPNSPTPPDDLCNSLRLLEFRLMPYYKQVEYIHKFLRKYINQYCVKKWTKDETLKFIIYLVKIFDYENT